MGEQVVLGQHQPANAAADELMMVMTMVRGRLQSARTCAYKTKWRVGQSGGGGRLRVYVSEVGVCGRERPMC